MNRSALFDRLNREFEVFGRRAHAALDEGKLQIELLRLRRQRDAAARDLGMLVHRRVRRGDEDQGRDDALLQRIDGLEAEISRLEGRVGTTPQQGSAPGAAGPSGM